MSAKEFFYGKLLVFCEQDFQQFLSKSLKLILKNCQNFHKIQQNPTVTSHINFLVVK